MAKGVRNDPFIDWFKDLARGYRGSIQSNPPLRGRSSMAASVDRRSPLSRERQMVGEYTHPTSRPLFIREIRDIRGQIIREWTKKVIGHKKAQRGTKKEKPGHRFPARRHPILLLSGIGLIEPVAIAGLLRSHHLGNCNRRNCASDLLFSK
jgi:hypothetical protein